VAYDAGLDTLLSEARKFGISVVTANQFLEQYPRRCAPQSWRSALTFFFSFPALMPTRSLQRSTAKTSGEILKNLQSATWSSRAIAPTAGSARTNVAQPKLTTPTCNNRCRARVGSEAERN